MLINSTKYWQPRSQALPEESTKRAWVLGEVSKREEERARAWQKLSDFLQISTDFLQIEEFFHFTCFFCGFLSMFVVYVLMEDSGESLLEARPEGNLFYICRI